MFMKQKIEGLYLYTKNRTFRAINAQDSVLAYDSTSQKIKQFLSLEG